MAKKFAIASGTVLAAVAGFVLYFNQDAVSAAEDWGLHIAIFDVGQADAIAIISSDGEACIIDAGRWSDDAENRPRLQARRASQLTSPRPRNS